MSVDSGTLTLRAPVGSCISAISACLHGSRDRYSRRKVCASWAPDFAGTFDLAAVSGAELRLDLPPVQLPGTAQVLTYEVKCADVSATFRVRAEPGPPVALAIATTSAASSSGALRVLSSAALTGTTATKPMVVRAAWPIERLLVCFADMFMNETSVPSARPRAGTAQEESQSAEEMECDEDAAPLTFEIVGMQMGAAADDAPRLVDAATIVASPAGSTRFAVSGLAVLGRAEASAEIRIVHKRTKLECLLHVLLEPGKAVTLAAASMLQRGSASSVKRAVDGVVVHTDGTFATDLLQLYDECGNRTATVDGLLAQADHDFSVSVLSDTSASPVVLGLARSAGGLVAIDHLCLRTQLASQLATCAYNILFTSVMAAGTFSLPLTLTKDVEPTELSVSRVGTDVVTAGSSPEFVACAVFGSENFVNSSLRNWRVAVQV